MPRPGLGWKRNKRPRCTISLKQDRGPWISYSECPPPPMSISLTFCPDRSAHYASVGDADEADQARSVPADDSSKSRAGSCLRCSWSQWCSSATLQILHCTPYSYTMPHLHAHWLELGLRCNFDLCSAFRGYGGLRSAGPRAAPGVGREGPGAGAKRWREARSRRRTRGTISWGLGGADRRRRGPNVRHAAGAVASNSKAQRHRLFFF